MTNDFKSLIVNMNTRSSKSGLRRESPTSSFVGSNNGFFSKHEQID